MEYNANELETLNYLKRTDFKNIQKGEVVNLVSGLLNMRPEVQKEVIKQFPELSSLLKTTLVEYSSELKQIVESDDASTKSYYDIANKEMDISLEGRKASIEIAKQILNDCQKCLDDSEMSEDSRLKILEREHLILKELHEQEDKYLKHEERIEDNAFKKDSEKKEYNKWIAQLATVATAVVVTVAVNALGGDLHIKLPNKK